MPINTFIRSEVRTVLNQNGGDFPTEDTINKLTAMIQIPSEILERLEVFLGEFAVQSLETADSMSKEEFIDLINRLQNDVWHITNRSNKDVIT
jgi:hypothetical protein